MKKAYNPDKDVVVEEKKEKKSKKGEEREEGQEE